MDLVPKPDQVVAAASNIAHLLLDGGWADLRPMPRSMIAAGSRHEIYHYDPDPAHDQEEQHNQPDRPGHPSGDPLLLVASLAAPTWCYDLRRGCSLVEHLVERGRPTYLVEYDAVSFSDRDVGLQPWAQDAVPSAIRAVSEHAGGRPVHVVGWALGGIFALLAAADSPDLPIASLSVLGSPVDTTLVPMVAPLRPLLTASTWPHAVTRTYRALGDASAPLRWTFERAMFQRLVAKPIAVATHLDDADWLGQLEAVDRFTASMTAYAGRSFGQLYHRFGQGNALASGSIELDGHDVSLSAVRPPTLVVAGSTDGIAPVGAVRALLSLLTGAREVRFEIVPGGHLGLLTGRAARDTTWPALAEWWAQWDGQSGEQSGAPSDAPRRTAKRPSSAAKRARRGTAPRTEAR